MEAVEDVNCSNDTITIILGSGYIAEDVVSGFRSELGFRVVQGCRAKRNLKNPRPKAYTLNRWASFSNMP